MSRMMLTLLSAESLKQYYASRFWQDYTIYDLARQHAEKNPDSFAVRDGHRRITYGQLVAAADRVANDLAHNGIRPGQHVAIWLPSRIETVISFLACSRNAYVCCPSLHRKQPLGEVAALLQRFRASAVITERGYGPGSGSDISAELMNLDCMRKVYELAPLDDQSCDHSDLDHLFADAADPSSPPQFSRDPNSIVYLAFTSGTTGEPKGVMHSDNTLLANARAMAGDWNFTSESVLCTLGPLSHNLGFGAMVTALAVGAEIVLFNPARDKQLSEFLIDSGTTFIFGVPTHAIDLLEELRHREPGDWSTIEGFRISGAAAPKKVVTELIEIGITPQTGYGMTEACSHNYTLQDDDPDLIINTAGRTCPGYEIRIWSSDDPNQEVESGTVGQIGGKGASLMLGYYDDQRATDESFNSHGWFMTGDLGSLDENGYLTFEGRAKDLIIRGAKNIYPNSIEQAAVRCPQIERAAAVPVTDERLGEKVCLIVQHANDSSMEATDILKYLKTEGLATYYMPEYIVQIDEMPVTSTGKILKRTLLSMLDDGQLTPLPVRWAQSEG